MCPQQHVRVNRDVYDRMAAASNPLCQPATDRELANPLATIDPAGWLEGPIHGKHTLCLAAGGGRHSVLYAAAGAQVTVVDISPVMLQLDRQMATRHQLSIQLIQSSMEDLSILPSERFDIVVQPVSTCYVPDIAVVFDQIARVIRPGGIYVSQHKQPVSLQTSTRPLADRGYLIQHAYYRNTPLPPPPTSDKTTARLRELGATEYLHRWEQIVGGMCRSGFVVEDLVEPRHDGHSRDAPVQRNASQADGFARRAAMVAPYVRIKARRKPHQQPKPSPLIWT